MVNFLLALISFHPWGWAPALSISSRIHWLGWFTRSSRAVTGIGIEQPRVWWGPSNEPLSCGWDGTGGPHWEVAMGGSMDKGVEGQGASSCFSALPPARIVVSSMGRLGSLPKSPPMSNWTCFFFWSLGAHSSMGSCGGNSLVCLGASLLCALLQDFCGLGCRWRSPREQLIHSFAGHGHGWLGEGDWHILGGWGKGLQCLCEWFWLLEQEHHLLACLLNGSSLGCLAASAPWGLAEGDWAHLWEHPPTLWGGPSRYGSPLEASSGHMLGQFQAQFLYAFLLLMLGSMLGAVIYSLW